MKRERKGAPTTLVGNVQDVGEKTMRKPEEVVTVKARRAVTLGSRRSCDYLRLLAGFPGWPPSAVPDLGGRYSGAPLIIIR